MIAGQVFADHEGVSRFAADWLVEAIAAIVDPLICVASGGTPERTYEILAERFGGPRPQPPLRIIKLDEWGGVPLDDPATCESHLRRALGPLLADNHRYLAFEGLPADPAAECARVAAWLAANGPIDLCVLGLGLNGHLGFNEPAESLQPHAHVATLSATSLTHPMVGRRATPPTFGLTLGMADLLQSRRVLLLATGEKKREPLRRMVKGEITTQFPASLLQLHADVTVVCDEAASPG